MDHSKEDRKLKVAYLLVGLWLLLYVLTALVSIKLLSYPLNQEVEFWGSAIFIPLLIITLVWLLFLAHKRSDLSDKEILAAIKEYGTVKVQKGAVIDHSVSKGTQEYEVEPSRD
jgi:hypothetical protein